MEQHRSAVGLGLAPDSLDVVNVVVWLQLAVQVNSLHSPCGELTHVLVLPVSAAKGGPPSSDPGQADGEGVD